MKIHNLYVCLFLLIFSMSCSADKQIVMKKGKMNLEAFDFDKGDIVALDGDVWEFYWKQLYYPKNFDSSKTSPDTYIRVPGPWTAAQIKDKTVSTYGYATYRLALKVPKSKKSIGLYIPKIWCASKIWVDDVLVHQMGKVGKTYETYQNNILEKLISFSPKSEEITLTIQVANHDLFVAGLMQSFKIGNYENLIRAEYFDYSRAVMWLGALFIMGLYHFILFFYRRKNKAPLFVGLICMFIGVRLLVFGNHFVYEYLKLYGNLSFAIQSRVYYMTTFLLIPITFFYVQSLYPDKIKNIFIKIVGIYAISICFFALVISPNYFSPLIPILQGIAFAFLIYPVVGIIRAAIKKREDSLLQIIGLVVMILAGINDALHTIGIKTIGTLELLPSAFGIFLCLQFLIIARRFSRAFNQVEDLNLNLENKVVKRTEQLNQKNFQLEESNHELEAVNNKLETTNKNLEEAYEQITASVRYASRIQNAVIGDPDEVIKNFKDGFILFSPRDIVSGDFYWYQTIKQQDEVLKILVTADCTGHGVPGAFMTLLGSNFLEEIVTEEGSVCPEKILTALDEKIFNVLNKQGDKAVNDGMDLTISVVDEAKRKLYFSGAKNAMYLVRDNNLQEFKGGLFPIGGNSQFDGSKVFKRIDIDIQEGDIFYSASDGFQDQFGGKEDKKFMKKKFKRLLTKVSTLPLQEQKEVLMQTITEWRGERKQTDDIIVLGIQVL